jgi:transcriptional regulator GlxA family with amidase domain
MTATSREPRRATYRVSVLVLRDCPALVPLGIADLLRKTSLLSAADPNRRNVEISLVSTGTSRDVVCAGGVRVRCDGKLAAVRRADLVIVPAVDPDIDAHIQLNRAVPDFLSRSFERGADVASVCTGAFLLGEAGLLDGRSATTHWAFQPAFAQRFPKTRLLPQAIVVDEGRVITAGGATSFVNLALHIAERIFGPEAARTASRMFLIDVNKAPQSAYAMFASQKLHDDEDILRAQAFIERRPQHSPSVEELARAVAMSPRTFSRRFHAATGNTPREYIQRVKIEAAKRKLEAGGRIATVASAVGYADAVAFRKLFARETGMTPADYRARYGPRTTPSTVQTARKKS